MTDIYKTPASQLTESPDMEGFGSLERGQAGQFKFSINDIINEAWAKTKGKKGAIWAAAFIYIIVLGPVSVGVPMIMEAFGFASQPVPGQVPEGRFFVGFLLSQLIILAITLPAGAGFFMVGLKIASGMPVSATEVVSYYHKTLPLLLTVILMYIMMIIGFVLFIIPGIYLAVAYYLAIPLVVEKGLSPWRALEASRKAVGKCWFRFLGLGLVMMIITMLGMIPLGIGLIWAIPLMLIAFGIAYRNIFGVEGVSAA